jgi:hypothetical protein
MSKKIKIKSAPGTQSSMTDGTDDLVGCYFQEQSGSPGNYLFYTKANPPAQITTSPQPVQTETDFTFTLDGLFWSITDFIISESAGSASGSWTATTPAPLPDAVPSEEGGDPETGTFQANDTVFVEGDASASSANA